MTTRPDRLVIVFADEPRGRPAAASYQTLIEVSPGRDVESLEPIDEVQLAELLPQFNAGLLAERDSFRANLDECTVQLGRAHEQLESVTESYEAAIARIDALSAEIEQLRNPPRPAEITPAQLRVWLISNLGLEALVQIDSMIISIEDPLDREVAKIKWEYGISVLRSDPLLTQFGKALGLSDEQIDAAFLEASKL